MDKISLETNKECLENQITHCQNEINRLQNEKDETLNDFEKIASEKIARLNVHLGKKMLGSSMRALLEGIKKEILEKPEVYIAKRTQELQVEIDSRTDEKAEHEKEVEEIEKELLKFEKGD